MELNYQSMKVAHQAREAVSEHGLLFLVVLRKFDAQLFSDISLWLTSSGSEQMGTELSGTVSSGKLKAYVSRCWSICFTHVMGFLYCRFHERGS